MKKQKIMDWIKTNKFTLFIEFNHQLEDGHYTSIDVNKLKEFINEQQEYKGII